MPDHGSSFVLLSKSSCLGYVLEGTARVNGSARRRKREWIIAKPEAKGDKLVDYEDDGVLQSEVGAGGLHIVCEGKNLKDGGVILKASGHHGHMPKTPAASQDSGSPKRTYRPAFSFSWPMIAILLFLCLVIPAYR